MTGKQLKEWAASISDDAVIEMKERSYSSWNEDFSLRATLQKEWDWVEEKKKETKQAQPIEA